jgi:hypothetical protein
MLKSSKLFIGASSHHPESHPPSTNLCGGSVGGNLAAVEDSSIVGSGADDVVLVVAVVVASVNGVVSAPGLGVESAVGTEGNTVLGQDIGCEEVARLVLAGYSVSEVLLVESGLRLASGGAEGGVVGVGVEETHAVVGVVVLAVLLDERSVDGGRKVGGSVEVGNSGGALARSTVKLGVSVGSSDHNVKVLAVLALVGGRCHRDGVSVDGALDVGLGKGVWAVWARLNCRVALKEDIEAVAEVLAVAEGSTGLRVVSGKGLVGQVSNLLSRTGSVGEGLGVAGRSTSIASSSPENVVAVEVFVDRTLIEGWARTAHIVSWEARG